VTSKTKGCFLGGFFGIVVFVLAVAVSNDAPDFGGIFVVPFFVLFFAGLGTLVGWLVGTPLTLSRPTRGDFASWGKGCLMAIGLCALILLLLAGVGRYLASP
jgi:hypothetical protein